MAEYRPNIDFTTKLEAPERRMDSFARLLESRSKCVAIALLEGKLYVTANELQCNSRVTNAIKTSINTTYGYFSNIAKSEQLDKSEQEKIRQEICSIDRVKARLARDVGHIPVNFSEKILKGILNSDNKSITEILLSYGNSNNASIAGYMWGLYASLLRDFKKLEEGIIRKDPSAAAGGDGKITDELLNALKQDLVLLAEEPAPGIHAEVQILSKIVTMINNKTLQHDQEIYIGISKRCCLNCSAMLEAANDVLKGYKICIKTRGTHGLDFKWAPPALFEEGYNQKNISAAKKKSIEYSIGQLAKEIFEKQAKSEEVQTNMGASQSESDIDQSLEEVGKIKNFEIQRSLALLEQLDKKSTFEEIIFNMTLATRIYKTRVFNTLMQIQPVPRVKKEEASEALDSIYAQLSEPNPSSSSSSSSLSYPMGLSHEKLLEILKQKAFFGEMAQYFAELEPEDLGKSATPTPSIPSSASSSSAAAALSTSTTSTPALKSHREKRKLEKAYLEPNITLDDTASPPSTIRKFL